VDRWKATFNQHSKQAIKVDKNNLLSMIEFVIHNTYFQFGSNVYRQTIGVPMGTSCAPYLANLTLFSYEFKYITKQLKLGRYTHCRDLNLTFRYIDDISIINDNNTFDTAYKDIYPRSLTLKKINETNSKADILDIASTIKNGVFQLSVFDKRRNFPFACNSFPSYDSNLSVSCLRNVIYNELARIFKICSNWSNFENNTKILENILLVKGYPDKHVSQIREKFLKLNKLNIQRKFA